MAHFHNNALVGASGQGGYLINQSLRFNSADSAYLNRTPASAGNRKTWTWSGWVKRSNLGAVATIFDSRPTGEFAFGFTSGDNFYVGVQTGNLRVTNAVFRDASAWYHLVVSLDTTQATASNRLKIYANGSEITAFSTTADPAQNTEYGINLNQLHSLGRYTTGGYFNGYLAEVNFIDGQALTPSSFGETDTITGAWIPKKYSGSYGTNGFYLKFLKGALGADSSGNSNNWTANNFAEEYSSVNYASNWIGSTSGTPYSGSWENVFNGNITVYADFVYAYNNTITLTFSTPLTGTIEVYGSDGGDGTANSGYIGLSDSSQWSINSVARASAYWYSFGSKTNITSITVSSPGGNGAILGAIRVNGQLLANNSAKATYDNFDDTPTNNWCTLNPVFNTAAGSITSDGNLKASFSSDSVTGTFGPASGKWYFEVTVDSITTNAYIGIADQTLFVDTSSFSYSQVYVYLATAVKGGNGSTSSYGATYGAGDVIGVAYNLDAGEITFYKNGVSQGVAFNSGFGSGYNYRPFSFSQGGGQTFNFGQRAFAYTPPTGFKALNTANLPEPTIKKGSSYFDTVLWTGNQTARTISMNSTFTPDFIWIKNRTSGYNHSLQDNVRGYGASTKLNSNTTAAENSANTEPQAGYISSVGAGSFSLDASATATWYHNNLNSNAYVGWCWKANGAGSSNTAGTITSTVSANASAGFSIVSYTGTGANATVGHGLGVAPKFFFGRNRNDTSGTLDWIVYHESIGNTGRLKLNTTDSTSTSSTFFQNTSPSSTVITIGTSNDINKLNGTYIMYCFSEVAGYSKFGSYTGNGSSDGPFVFCGFRPRWIMIKVTNVVTTSWMMRDTARNPYNIATGYLFPNSSSAEFTNLDFDIYSNGFKPRHANNVENSSGSNYIFAAFAELPAKYSNAR